MFLIITTRLKAWRKGQAEKDDVPVYIVGTNREFADIVRNPAAAENACVAQWIALGN